MAQCDALPHLSLHSFVPPSEWEQLPEGKVTPPQTPVLNSPHFSSEPADNQYVSSQDPLFPLRKLR